MNISTTKIAITLCFSTKSSERQFFEVKVLEDDLVEFILPQNNATDLRLIHVMLLLLHIQIHFSNSFVKMNVDSDIGFCVFIHKKVKIFQSKLPTPLPPGWTRGYILDYLYHRLKSILFSL